MNSVITNTSLTQEQAQALYPTITNAPIPVTVFLKPALCMLGIDLLGRVKRFVFEKGNVYAVVDDSDKRRAFAWPSEDVRQEVLMRLDIAPETVFIVEFSPAGEPVTEHDVVKG